MLAAKIDDRHAGLMLLQNPDDLFFRKAAALHALVLVVTGANIKLNLACRARSDEISVHTGAGKQARRIASRAAFWDRDSGIRNR